MYILADVVGVSGNVFIEPCQLHLMLFIIPLIYGEQFKTKLQWLNAFYALSERLTCNFGGISGVKSDGRLRGGPVRYSQHIYAFFPAAAQLILEILKTIES